LDLIRGFETTSNQLKTDSDQPSPCIQPVDKSDNILIKHKKFSIPFDLRFGKRFYTAEYRFLKVNCEKRKAGMRGCRKKR